MKLKMETLLVLELIFYMIVVINIVKDIRIKCEYDLVEGHIVNTSKVQTREKKASGYIQDIELEYRINGIYERKWVNDVCSSGKGYSFGDIKEIYVSKEEPREILIDENIFLDYFLFVLLWIAIRVTKPSKEESEVIEEVITVG